MFVGQWWKDQLWWVLPSSQEYRHSHKDGRGGVDELTDVMCVYFCVFSGTIKLSF